MSNLLPHQLRVFWTLWCVMGLVLVFLAFPQAFAVPEDREMDDPPGSCSACRNEGPVARSGGR